MTTVVAYDRALRCEEARAIGGRVPAINTYVERADGQLRSVLALRDTGAGFSVFDGRVAVGVLGFDPRAAPTEVVPRAGLGSERSQAGYVHALRCYFGGYTRFADLVLHVAFSDPSAPELLFIALGREGLNGAQDRGFFSQVQFGYRHRVPGGPPEVYLTFSA